MAKEATSQGNLVILRDLKYTLEPEESLKDLSLHNTPKTEIDKETLDLFLPPSVAPLLSDKESGTVPVDKGDRKDNDIPVAVFVHGGGWKKGDKHHWRHFCSVYDTNLLLLIFGCFSKLYDNIGKTLANQGIACAVVSYPLSRLDLPWLLVEKFLSFLSSMIVVSIIAFWLYIGCFMANLNIFENASVLWHFTLFLLVYNFIVLAIQMLTRHLYNVNTWKRMVTLIVLIVYWCIALCVVIAFLDDMSFYCVGLHSCLIQCWLVYLHVNDVPKTTHPAQIEAVARSIQWVVKMGKASGFYDPDKLFLMGHSAGAHLVSLVTVSPKYLDEETFIKIKGVISISGLYDASKAVKIPILAKHLYLIPAFGRDSLNWDEASVVNVLKTEMAKKPRVMPHFLVLNPQLEFCCGIFENTEQFVLQMRELGVDVTYFVLENVTHNMLVYLFGKASSFGANMMPRRTFEYRCIWFIKKCLGLELPESTSVITIYTM